MPDHRLTPQERRRFAERWEPYGITLDQGLKLRRAARADLFFLAKDLLGYDKLTEHAHREVCAHFVEKDPDAEDFETFARAYTGLHDRLTMLCRGGFKSTIDIADKVQAIICFPDIRINILTDRLELSQEFVAGIVGHFTLQLNGDPAIVNGETSMFQLLFYEFCEATVRNFTGTIQTPQWTTPARQNRRLLSPTVRARGLDAGKTGTHCDWLAIDDAITPESVGTGKSVPGNLRNIETKIAMARKLVVSYGFVDNIGTPQHALDYNAQTVARERQRQKDGLLPLTQVLIRPAMTRKPGCEDVPFEELQEDQAEMWCPEVVPFRYLVDEWHRPGGRDTVATQYLLDVSLKQLVKFAREQLVRSTLAPQRIPSASGLTVIPWDLAYSQTNRADYTVGLPIRIAGGRFYVLDKVRGRFNEDELPAAIAATIYKWMPDRVAIENSQGAKWLRREIQREMEKLGCEVPIEYVDIGQGIWRRNEVNAGPVVRLLGDQRLFFSTAIPKIEELYDELEAFPHPQHKDDIVACLNLGVNHFLTAAELTVQESYAPAPDQDPRERLWHEQIYGYGRGQQFEEPVPMVEDRGSYGLLPDILGGVPE
jgi:phage terminase large subunit-like protein